jgi:hypothetical protein
MQRRLNKREVSKMRNKCPPDPKPRLVPESQVELMKLAAAGSSIGKELELGLGRRRNIRNGRIVGHPLKHSSALSHFLCCRSHISRNRDSGGCLPGGWVGGGVVEWNSRLNVNPSHGLDGLPNYLSGLQLPKLHKT